MVLRPDQSWHSVDGLLALGGKNCTAEIGVGGMTWCSEEVGSTRGPKGVCRWLGESGAKPLRTRYK